MVGKSAKDIQNHLQSDHNNIEQSDISREVCWHRRQGNCFRGNSCRFSHVGHQKSSTSTRSPSIGAKSCHNGMNCQWKEKGECQYFHEGIVVQKSQRVHGLHGGHQEAGGNQEAHQPKAQGRKLCRWNE